MAAPIYYFPKFEGATVSDKVVKDRIATAGLADTLGGAQYDIAVVTDGMGPDGLGGLAIACKPPPGSPGRLPNTGFYPDDQTWVHVAPKGYWLGLQNSQPVTPDDLLRNPSPHCDYEIELAGHRWAIMALYPFERPGSIPRVGRQDENWEWVWPTHPKYDALIKRYEKVFMGEEGTMGEWGDLAVDTLAINYRIDKHLAMLLNLFQREDCGLIFDLAMDVPERSKYTDAKKKDQPPSDASGMSAGELTPSPSQTSNPPS